ncbi:stalk domain-containing protein [Paenibacillus amylolyticus]|uniref:stalk domain-containing protein n=1 Tax=Paenibacillus amylolyticus TaxID=1451 RepID=UPI003EC09F79
MKKAAYIAGGILIGFVLSTSAGAFADSVKSIIGKKVSGEYTVIVNGQKLADKGAVIDGKANVPVRGISEALGADIKVEGKTITVTTTEAPVAGEPIANDYEGKTKEFLTQQLSFYTDNLLKPNLAGKSEIEAEIKKATDSGNKEFAETKRKQLDEYNARIAEYEKEIADINSALAALK